jgi:uncharacterized membrane protein
VSEQDLFVFMSIYDDPADAADDMATLRRLHADDRLAAYDAAVARKDADGNVTIDKREVPREQDATTGLVAGAVLGLVFPPSILLLGGAGAGIGALVGHFGRGLSRDDVKDLGELLDEGQAALVVVAGEPVAKPLYDAGMKARTYVQKELYVDPKEVDRHLAEIEKELADADSS